MAAHFSTFYYYDVASVAGVLGREISLQFATGTPEYRFPTPHGLPRYRDAIFCTKSSRRSPGVAAEDDDRNLLLEQGFPSIKSGLRCRRSSLFGGFGVVRGICQVTVAWAEGKQPSMSGRSACQHCASLMYLQFAPEIMTRRCFRFVLGRRHLGITLRALK